MPSRIDQTAGEVDWPAWAERTPPAERKRTSKYSKTLAKSISALETELLDRVGADDWRLSTAAPHRKDDGRPYANASPDDPAVAVRWTMGGDQYCVACDHYTDLRDNVRTIGLYVREKRKMSDRPVTTGQDEFATARLPGDVEPDAEPADPPAHEVLEVAPDAGEAVVEAAARQKKAETHPDKPEGSREAFARVQRAEDRMLSEAGGGDE